MTVLNIKCLKCEKVFKNTDKLYSLSCGHVFHSGCFKCGLNCPHCHIFASTFHKLDLSFDETATNELELKLKDSVEKIQQLQCQKEEVTRGLQEKNHLLKDSEANFSQLQQQYTDATKEFYLKLKDSDEKIQQLQCQNEEVTRGLQEKNRLLEANFLQLQQQYTESEESLKELRENMQVLTIENKFKLKETSLKTIEIETLNEKIKILEQKLKYIKAEFEKEISNSAKLEIDQMKLNSYMERMKLEAEKDNENPAIQKENSTNAQSGAVGVQLAQSPLNSTLESSNSKEENVMDSTAGSIPNVNETTRVVIFNYPFLCFDHPLKNIIINLALAMNLILTQEDLKDVRILEQINVHPTDVPPNKLTLIVQFRSLDWKNKFLLNKNKIKQYSSYRHLTISDHANCFCMPI